MNKADITHNIQMKTKDVLIYVLNFMVDSILIASTSPIQLNEKKQPYQ